PLVVLDVAHNTDGIKQLVQQIELSDHHQLHIIIGMVKDKEVESVLELLPKQARYYFTKAQIPRALPEEELQEKALSEGLKGHTYVEVNEAIHAALSVAGNHDMIIVCGSVFLVGEVNNGSIRQI
ncbi:MAG: bifunctional folylpolyglutamate synthase/dihydrofolate synthase, partial [Chitinophagaceae bacterium]|nr:bifunctional folylpolyglutamate synthase/dihydrofolate synthase [Chitinophagaceae bacterium]